MLTVQTCRSHLILISSTGLDLGRGENNEKNYGNIEGTKMVHYCPWLHQNVIKVLILLPQNYAKATRRIRKEEGSLDTTYSYILNQYCWRIFAHARANESCAELLDSLHSPRYRKNSNNNNNNDNDDILYFCSIWALWTLI